jgi:hypothetical protein
MLICPLFVLSVLTASLAAQLATAAASSGTYGFNAGIEFDIDVYVDLSVICVGCVGCVI